MMVRKKMNNNIPNDCVIVKLKEGFEVATIQTFHIVKGQESTCPLDIFKISTNLDLVSNPHNLKLDDAAVATSSPEIDPDVKEAEPDYTASDALDTTEKADSDDSEEKNVMETFTRKSSGKNKGKKKK